MSMEALAVPHSSGLSARVRRGRERSGTCVEGVGAGTQDRGRVRRREEMKDKGDGERSKCGGMQEVVTSGYNT